MNKYEYGSSVGSSVKTTLASGVQKWKIRPLPRSTNPGATSTNYATEYDKSRKCIIYRVIRFSARNWPYFLTLLLPLKKKTKVLKTGKNDCQEYVLNKEKYLRKGYKNKNRVKRHVVILL